MTTPTMGAGCGTAISAHSGAVNPAAPATNMNPKAAPSMMATATEIRQEHRNRPSRGPRSADLTAELRIFRIIAPDESLNVKMNSVSLS
jgi:hypothetical protein